MACTKEELDGYTPLDVDTYIAPSFARDSAHSDDYPPYNKPGAVTHWLRVSRLLFLAFTYTWVLVWSAYITVHVMQLELRQTAGGVLARSLQSRRSPTY